MADRLSFIAAVNGYSVGIGLTLIMPFDVRIASTDALFSIRFIKVGLMPELGSTRLLAQLVGLGNAADMCLTGRMVPTDEALRIGLVIKVTEPEDLLDAAVEKANEIASNPPQAVMFVKELLRKNPLDPDIDRVGEREGIRDQIARRPPDHAEALAAFMEKREPRFGQDSWPSRWWMTTSKSVTPTRGVRLNVEEAERRGSILAKREKRRKGATLVKSN